MASPTGLPRVVLTQPRPRADALAERWRRAGAEVAVCSTAEVLDRSDRLDVAGVLARAPAFDLVVFTSPTAAGLLAPHLARRAVRRPRLATVGPGSLEALAAGGVAISEHECIVPDGERHDAQALLACPAISALDDAQVLVVRGEHSRTDWSGALRERGARVTECRAYATRPVRPFEEDDARLRAWADAAATARVILTAVDALERVSAHVAGLGVERWFAVQPMLAVHPRIAQAARDLGWAHVETVPPGEAALSQALGLGPGPEAGAR